jgi:uncharacterized protein YjiS (DUF1127 family)
MLIHWRVGELKRRGRLAGWLARLSRRWLNMIQTRRALRRLSAADDHMLKDIGVSRGDLEWLVRHGRSRAKSSAGD